jgi:excisionase family DNA binding protein
MSAPERLRLEALLPSEHEEKQAFEAGLTIEKYVDQAEGLDLAIRLDGVAGPGGPVVSLPPPAVKALARILEHFADGNGVLVTPIHREISTQQAADLLHVSRPHLVRMLEHGVLPYRHVGTRRRIKLKDVVAYKERQVAERREALDEITALVGHGR